ncbi:MAG: endonuclease domain-containing protein [Bacteroidetes bacterium]|nr:endonuclease domain-containing protein [Bacteroidota bacterium]MBK7107776.1 endonuclease domain-containing protein [Bacteroidota bacterium]MBK8486795.1 endonuclease domain-containing protein [Bacteroidota bacterium]MBK8681310.1 endonuclease domain-containing protein [Bacteroidota bacterium]MBP8754866.1 endonuclease domain-containing protein [Chitinophagales bacterium]
MNSKEFARHLRKNMTSEESLMWGNLRNRNCLGLKFVRQHPVYYPGEIGKSRYFIADFYCEEKKLVIEIDGGIHLQQIEYDNNRDTIMQEMGLQVLRIKNEEIKSMSATLEKLKMYLSNLPSYKKEKDKRDL